MLCQTQARITMQGVSGGNCDSLFKGYNVAMVFEAKVFEAMVFELAPHRASQIAPISVVIKYECRITILQFYA